MGLSIVVGILAEAAPVDEEGAERFRHFFRLVNQRLAKHGLPPHFEPETPVMQESRCEMSAFYSWLHYLRRAYAHRVADPAWMATPLSDDEDPCDDPLVETISMRFQSHLLCHSDCEGFYLPIDFKEVIFDDDGDQIPGAMVGSSYRLRDELVFVAPALGISLRGRFLSDEQAEELAIEEETEAGLYIERSMWLKLFEAARLSIQHKAAICFS